MKKMIFSLLMMGAIATTQHINAQEARPLPDLGTGEEVDIFFFEDGEGFMADAPMMLDMPMMNVIMEDETGLEAEFPPIGMGDGAAEKVDLSKDQKDKIRKIRGETKKQNITLRGSLELKQIELRELLDAENPSKEQIAAKVKEIESLKTQMKMNHINARLDCRNILTKEQREKMDQMRSERRDRWHEKRGHKAMKFKRFFHGGME